METGGLEQQLNDIQGNIVKGVRWKFAGYYFLTVSDPDLFSRAVRCALRAGVLEDAQTHAGYLFERRPPETAMNIAFTYAGLRRLGVARRYLASLPRAFREGMAARAQTLGDTADSAPEKWQRGYGSNDVHAVVSVFSMSEKDDIAERWRCIVEAGVEQQDEIGDLDQPSFPGSRVLWRERGQRMSAENNAYDIEPFGFRDGVSQPYLAGSGERRDPGGGSPGPNGQWKDIAAGEIILGQKDSDGLDQLEVDPQIQPLCQNGTYMVFRKLSQNVAAFEDFLERNADGAVERETLAAQMMGRWRNGTPLVTNPDGPRAYDGDYKPAWLNQFRYHGDDGSGHDPKGMVCPYASHVRRVNPRDDRDPNEVNRRRIIRRGIPYRDGGDQGLLFVCFNARIDSQFEFLQGEWINKGDFVDQFSPNRDPVVGSNNGAPGDTLTLPGKGEVLPGLPRFVTVRGGEYFLVPGITALHDLMLGSFRDDVPAEPSADPLPDTPDLVDHAFDLDVAALFKERRIDALHVEWHDEDGAVSRQQHVYYVACHDQACEVLSDDLTFTVDSYAEKIDHFAKDHPMLLGMKSDNPEKQARLAIFHAAFGSAEQLHPIAQCAAATIAKALNDKGPDGRLDLVNDIALAVPVQRVMHCFGIRPPDGISDFHRAWYFRQEDLVLPTKAGWLDAFPTYTDKQKPAAELAFLARTVVLELLINMVNATELRNAATEAARMIVGLVQRSIEEVEADCADLPDTLLGRLLDLRRRDPDAYPDENAFRNHVHMLLVELIVGGIDTTAKGIANVMDYLLTDPLAMAAAKQAVDRDGCDADLDAVIKEVLRLNPVAPIIVRDCPKGAVVKTAGNQRLEANSRVFVVAGAAMRDPAAVPGLPDPRALSRFDPARPSPKPLDFGLAPHRCLGEQIALAEIRAVLKALLPLGNLRRASGATGLLKEDLRLPKSMVVKFDPIDADGCDAAA